MLLLYQPMIYHHCCHPLNPSMISCYATTLLSWSLYGFRECGRPAGKQMHISSNRTSWQVKLVFFLFPLPCLFDYQKVWENTSKSGTCSSALGSIRFGHGHIVSLPEPEFKHPKKRLRTLYVGDYYIIPSRTYLWFW
jgi:hypothetical protein